MKLLGADISFSKDEIIINGVGLDGLRQPNAMIDAGNSGTLIRLLSGVPCITKVYIYIDWR